jgi:hypothetical protein
MATLLPANSGRYASVHSAPVMIDGAGVSIGAGASAVSIFSLFDDSGEQASKGISKISIDFLRE